MERVLVVDDDRALCQLVTRFLAREGFEISWAPSGNAGVERALAEDYSLIMLDVMMPDTDGFDVLRRTRQHSRTPVLMLTARADTHVCNLRRKLGPLGDGGERIKGVRGAGYLYASPAKPGAR